MRETKKAITVSGLRKAYPGREVLKGVDFSVDQGSIYTLLGSNGAGKTTTVRILTTQLQADSGEMTIEGCDVGKEPEKVHSVISLTGQFSAVDEALTGRENLTLMGKLYHLREPEKRAEELLLTFGLTEAADRAASAYSGGMKRRLDIAMSLTGSPRVVFLDEPTTGLDPQSRRSMWKMIRELNRSGVTIFLTTQYLEEAEELSDRIAILDQGRILTEGTPEELKSYLPKGEVQFTFSEPEMLERAEVLLKNYKLAKEPEAGRLTVFTDGEADTLTEIFHTFYEHGIRMQQFIEQTPTLEEVFLTMIGEHRKGEKYADKNEKI